MDAQGQTLLTWASTVLEHLLVALLPDTMHNLQERVKQLQVYEHINEDQENLKRTD
jgi:hypothetical protein